LVDNIESLQSELASAKSSGYKSVAVYIERSGDARFRAFTFE